MTEERPDGVPQMRVVPLDLPREIDGFRFARIVDGFDEGGRPRPWPSRPWLTDAGERERVLDYLRGAAMLHRSDDVTNDLFHPERKHVVPLSYRTDGTWIWNDALPYYVASEHLAPEPELLARIEAAGYRCPPVPEPTRLAAQAALYQRGRIEAEQQARLDERRYLAETPPSLVRGEASNKPPTIPYDYDRMDEQFGDDPRFEVNTERVLMNSGWMPGRDASARVDPWLEELCSRPTRLGRRHELFPAARDIYHEFGLLDVLPEVPGDEVPAFPIHFFPADVTLHSDTSGWFGDRLGRRVFPIAWIESDEPNTVVVDEDGRVYGIYEDGEYLLGATIDEALERLITGLRPERVRIGDR